MGHDFSDVKIHTGNEAATSANEIKARAYTTDNHIVFNEAEYNHSTAEGKKLLAHELAHVVQNKKGMLQNDDIHRKTLTPLCKRLDAFITYESIQGIDFMIGLETGKPQFETEKFKKKVENNIETMAKQIVQDNLLIKNPSERVKKCFIVGTSTRLALDNTENILLIHPKNADGETVAHEMGHALFSFMKNNTNPKLMDVKGTEKLLLKIADIFERLRAEKIEVTPKDLRPATHIVNPEVWGGLSPEHPDKDVDEFFASAKASFEFGKDALIDTIIKFGRHNLNIISACAELIKVLDDFFTKGQLPEPDEKIGNEKAARSKIAGISGPEPFERSLLTTRLLNTLVNKSC